MFTHEKVIKQILNFISNNKERKIINYCMYSTRLIAFTFIGHATAPQFKGANKYITFLCIINISRHHIRIATGTAYTPHAYYHLEVVFLFFFLRLYSLQLLHTILKVLRCRKRIQFQWTFKILMYFIIFVYSPETHFLSQYCFWTQYMF